MPSDEDLSDAILFRFWCRAASYPGGWPARLSELFQEESRNSGWMSPDSYRRALLRLAKEVGVNLPGEENE